MRSVFLFTNRAFSYGWRMLLLLIVLLNIPIKSSTLPDKNKEIHSYYFEFLTYKSDVQEQTILEIFCEIPSQNFQLVKTVNGDMVIFEIETTLFDLNGVLKEQLNYLDSVKVEPVDNISDMSKYNLVQHTLLINPGYYTVRVNITDKKSLKSFTIEKKLTIPDYCKKDLMLSSLQIASSIFKTDEESILVKNNMKFIPNVAHIVGMNHNNLYVYSEIYNLLFKENEINNKFSTTISIVDRYNNVVKKVTSEYGKPGESCILSFKISTDELHSGLYKLKLDVQDLDSEKRASNYVYFTVSRPYSRYSKEEYTYCINQLKYVASSNEIESLKSLPEHKRSEEINQFWASLDPTPDTERNEFMLEYYRRLNYANEHFNNVSIHGWETDQGEIYIKKGPPDNIAHVPSFLDNKTYEIWDYNQLKQKYVFVDELGQGQFKIFRALDKSNKELTLFE